MPGLALFRSLCAAFAAMVLLVSMPAMAAFNACDGRGSVWVVVSWEDAAWDVGADGGSEGAKGCTHCAFSHVGHSIAAPAGGVDVAAFDLNRDSFARRNDPGAALAARDGPEHPPKA